jgi:anti-sigma factor RsiW
MSHLGQRLSGLIDGELDGDERDRVLGHLARCGWCRDEAAALRTLKRRMNALGEAAAGAALTGRLMGLRDVSDAGMWSRPGPDWQPAERGDPRVGRYFLAGSVVVFLAGLGTAAFIAGGEPQAQAPAPRLTPSVDVFVQDYGGMSGLFMKRPEPHTGLPSSGESPSSRLP